MMDVIVRRGDEIIIGEQRQAVLSVLEAPVLLTGDGGFPLATEFRPPVENLDAAWYVAHRRGEYAYHPPAHDWNLESLGNTDLGEPLMAPWSGIVLSAYDWRGGTGRVVQILGVEPSGQVIVWAGWHLHEMVVEPGQVVRVGERIGTIGNADGRYAGSHLHEQICVINEWGVPPPPTFVKDWRYDWRDCRQFYLDHGVDPALIERLMVFDGA